MIACGLRLKQPSRVVIPLSAEQVETFWDSFRTFRDLAVVGLMLLDGLRSCEVLALRLEDLQTGRCSVARPGQRKQDTASCRYPVTSSKSSKAISVWNGRSPTLPCLFVSLKGSHRGQPMTACRTPLVVPSPSTRSSVSIANPHRFRHTFGADMVQAGISLPALQHLMGHSQIHTTMLYVQLAPQDVWREYARAVANRARLTSPTDAMSQSRRSLEQIFETHVQTLSLTLQPFTVSKYRYVCPPLRRLSSCHLSRGPPTLTTPSRSPYAGLVSLALRVASAPGQLIPANSICSVFAGCSMIWPLQGHPLQPGLIIREDFPVRPAVSPQASVSGR